MLANRSRPGERELADTDSAGRHAAAASGSVSPAMGRRPMIELHDVSKTFTRDGEPVQALKPVSLKVGAGEFVAIVGTSGCGKSTLMRIIAGLIAPTGGTVIVNGREVRGPDPDIGIVFQTPALLPWRSVRRNIELQLDIRRKNGDAMRDKVQSLIRLVGLEGFENRKPYELSGGMQQRVALCRALIHDPAILLMDEPFGALDAQTRGKLQDELLDIWAKQRTTVLFVTHSIDEALLLADRILVFTPRPGRIAADIKVDLPRPRETQSDAFAALAAELRGLIGADRDFD